MDYLTPGICSDITQTIGSTPLIQLKQVCQGLRPRILAKLEYFSPSGSIKDRIAVRMIEEAEESGDLKPGMTIIEGSSGNTGISLAMVGAAKGYHVMIVMPEKMSAERKQIICAYGAELVLTPGGSSNIEQVIDKVKEIKNSDPEKYWQAGQFFTPHNPATHYFGTGPEIWEQTGGSMDIFVASQGTGGTVSGAARFLKEQKGSIKVFTAEPAESAILSGGQKREHPLEGIGDGFVPPVLDLEILDGVLLVGSSSAIKMTRRLTREEGIFCGVSSGCNVLAALMLARLYPETGTIVTTINDNGLRYLSTELCREDPAWQEALPELEKELVVRNTAPNLKIVSCKE